MYEVINKKEKKKKSAEWPLIAGLGACFLVILIVVLSIIWSGWYQRRYWRFVGDLSESITYAYENDCLQVNMDDRKIRMSGDNAYKLYDIITSCGPGKVGTAPKEEAVVTLDFGDGSLLNMWSVKLVNSSTDRIYGVFVQYIDAEGRVYSYDTDQISVEKVLQYCRLENNQEWE